MQLAQDLRRNMTVAETVLWQRLRGHGCAGLRFRRQQVIDGFVVDFYCHAARLVVEVDGAVHRDQLDYDVERDRVLAARGLFVLRMTNNDVEQNLADVLERIAAQARRRMMQS